VVHGVAPAGARDETEVGAAERGDAALASIWQRASAATTMSPASAIRCRRKADALTAVTMACGTDCHAEGVDVVVGTWEGVAVGRKNFGMSRPR
jgi:hypothetical protein